MSPEEEETVEPASFRLDFLEVSHKAALAEYLSLLPKHISPEFAAATDVMRLMEEEGSKVFVPKEWTGMKGVPPIEFEFSADMPASMTPPRRRIHPKRLEAAEKEFARLRKYFYVDSDSPVSSALVIAEKATAPFIRFCGNYVEVNKYLVRCHYPIPDIRHQIDRLQQYRVFLDIDATNGFHNCRLAEHTQRMLSVQTSGSPSTKRCFPGRRVGGRSAGSARSSRAAAAPGSCASSRTVAPRARACSASPSRA